MRGIRPDDGLSDILADVSEASGVSVEQITGESRKEEIRIARQMFCYVARKTGKWSDEQIGTEITRDRTTVIHSCDVVENMLDTKEPNYTKLWNRILIS